MIFRLPFRGDAILKRLAYAATVLIMTIPQTFAQNTGNECTFHTCKAGTRALTSYDRSDPYLFLPNPRTCHYVGTLVALLAGR